MPRTSGATPRSESMLSPAIPTMVSLRCCLASQAHNQLLVAMPRSVRNSVRRSSRIVR